MTPVDRVLAAKGPGRSGRWIPPAVALALVFAAVSVWIHSNGLFWTTSGILAVYLLYVVIPSTRVPLRSPRQLLGRSDYVVPRQLPPAVQPFVGRRQELGLIVAHLRQARPGEPCLVLIRGGNGVGKTALAVRVAHLVADQFPAGQMFVRVGMPGSGGTAPIAQHVLTEVLGQLVGYLQRTREPVPDGYDQRLAKYRQLSRSSERFLVVFDDVADFPTLNTLLPDGGNWTVIATSGSQITGLTPVPLDIELSPLVEAEALELLRHIVGGTRIEREPDQAGKIAASTGGNPLSVHLTGTLLAARPASSLAAALEEVHEDPAVGDTLTSLDMSYALLTGEERTAFRLLGLLDSPSFPVWKLASLMDTDEPAATRIADRLVYAGLVERTSDDPAGVAVFTVPEMVQAYARARLGEELDPDEQRRLLDRLTLYGRHRRELRPTAQLKESVYLPFVRGELSAALTAARRAVALARDNSDPTTEGLALAAFAEVRAELGNLRAAEDLANAARAIDEPLGNARAMRCLGVVNRRLRQFAVAEEILAGALLVAGDNDRSERIRILRELAVTCSTNQTPNAKGARDAIDAAMRLCGERADTGLPHLPGLLWASSFVHAAAGQYDAALSALEHGQQNAVELGQHLWLAWLVHRRAEVTLADGRHHRARVSAFEALELFAGMSHRYGKAHCRLLIGQVDLARDQPQAALRVLEEAAEDFLNCGDRWAQAEATRMLAVTQRALGRREEAINLLGSCMRVFWDLRDDEGRDRVIRELSELAAEAGRVQRTGELVAARS
jgi:tetratricopeptide (TPR) repeat protein